GSKFPGGRDSPVPTPRTASPSSSTRSPRGPHDHRPGLLTGNRQRSDDASLGATAHARPPATKVSTAPGAGTPPSHPAGSESTRTGGRVAGVDVMASGPTPRVVEAGAAACGFGEVHPATSPAASAMTVTARLMAGDAFARARPSVPKRGPPRR